MGTQNRIRFPCHVGTIEEEIKRPSKPSLWIGGDEHDFASWMFLPVCVCVSLCVLVRESPFPFSCHSSFCKYRTVTRKSVSSLGRFGEDLAVFVFVSLLAITKFQKFCQKLTSRNSCQALLKFIYSCYISVIPRILPQYRISYFARMRQSTGFAVDCTLSHLSVSCRSPTWSSLSDITLIGTWGALTDSSIMPSSHLSTQLRARLFMVVRSRCEMVVRGGEGSMMVEMVRGGEGSVVVVVEMV